jgi:Holliday junction DNA helicase RuvA
MIAHLRGTLLAKRPNQAIVETHGVGYDVAISVPTFTEMPAAGAEVALHVHTHVREDALSLYGFLRLAEKQLFEKLLTVSGIGPKLAGASEMGARLASPVEEDVISALVNLGYQRAAADKALFGARGGKSPQSFEALFREALGLLSK